MTRSRIQVLDTFRALAILSVMFFHYTFRWGPLNAGQPDVYHFAANADWFRYGFLGVEFFFIISGFVIFMTVMRCATLVEFAVRRFARLYPTYLFCMTLTFLFLSLAGIDAFHRTLFEYAVGFTMQSSHFRVAWIDGAYWSLLVEAKFYFYIALFHFVLRRYFYIAWAVLAVLGIAANFVSPLIADALFITQALPFFCAGMAFYLQYQQRKLNRDAMLLLAVAALTYAVFWHAQPWPVHVGVLIMICLFQGFIAGKLEFLALRPLLFIGAISYPLYLIHQDIGVTIIARLNAYPALNGALAIGFASACVIFIAWLIHRYVEIPSQDGTIALFTRMTGKPWLPVKPALSDDAQRLH